jgi:hypothetical protein
MQILPIFLPFFLAIFSCRFSCGFFLAEGIVTCRYGKVTGPCQAIRLRRKAALQRGKYLQSARWQRPPNRAY